jgi:hypothetical protein
MEDRTTIREKHGIANARKVSVAAIADSDIQAVTVTDGTNDEVLLALSSSSFPAAMTPEQAKVIAKMLVDSANRILRRS